MTRSPNNYERTRHYTVTQSRIGITRSISGQSHERKQQLGMEIWGGGYWSRPTLAVLLLVSCAIGRSYAADIAYCSSDNTAEDSTITTSIYQSNGLCTNACLADYAFAVLQGSKCWCSNYIPASTISGCDQTCPGYPSELCGSTTKKLYGYIALDNNLPSGTASASSTVRSTSNPPATSIDTTSVSAPLLPPSISTVVEEKPGPTTTLIITTTPKSTSQTTSSSSTSTQTTLISSTITSSTSVSIVTSPGGVRTVTLIPESTTSLAPTKETSTDSGGGGFFSQPGRVAGVFIGVALIVIALFAGLLFFYFRRNRQKDSIHGGTEAGTSIVIPAGGAGVMATRRRSRSLSTLGLIGEKGFHSVNSTPASVQTNMVGLNGIGNSVERAPDGTKLVDQRLDPNQLYLRYDPDTGSSRMSVRSLRDDADYSRRVLRLANPDD